MKNQIVYIFLAFVFGLTSCQDVIDIELDTEDNVLVVEAELNNIDSIQWVKLSYTADYFNNPDNVATDYTREQNATVVLLENGIVVDTMTYNINTFQFESAFTGTIGNTYQLRIVTTDGTVYASAEEELPNVPPIDSLYYIKNNYNDPRGINWDIMLETQELPEEGNYYQWKIFLNGAYQDGPEDLAFTDDSWVNGSYIEEFDVYTIDEDQFIENTTTQPYIDVRLIQMAITKSNYEFLYNLQTQTAFASTPFASPPAEIKGNVFVEGTSERALGMFVVTSYDVDTVRVFEN